MGFQLVDYLLFAGFLCLSIGVGIFHAIKSRRQLRRTERSKGDKSQTAEFLMGGRSLPIVPVALSLLTTFLSGITLLGSPAEIYLRGFLFWVLYIFGSFAFIISGVFFVPIFYKFKPISVYQYFELRFNSRLLRRIAAFIFLINSIFYMSVVMYAPSVALSGVTKVPMWPFILLVGIACTTYTSIGGLKAVVWTDTLQAVFMYAGVGTLIVKGTMDAGGLSRVFRIAAESGRVAEMGYISPNPAQHNSLWIASLGGIVWWTTLYGLNQMSLQRYCSMASLRHSQIVVAITVPAFVVLGSMACFIGAVMLAYYYDCDPLAAGQIDSQDQLVIYFASAVLSVMPGLPGLFLACLFSGTLSTISSGMNSMAAVMWEDFINPWLGARINDQQAARLNKALVVVFGVLATVLAFGAEHLGGMIKAAINVMGALAGPLVGLFVLGIFFPSANKRGAFVALVVSELFLCWVCIGNFVSNPYAANQLPLNNTCLLINATQSSLNDTPPQTADPHYGDQSVFYLYRLSTFLYSLIGVIMVVLIGVSVSYVWPEGAGETSAERKLKYCMTYAGRHVPIPTHDSVSAEKEAFLRKRSVVSY